NFEIAARVSEQRIRERDRDGATNRETIESVREIDRVRCARDHNHEKYEREKTHVRDYRILEKRQVQRARLHFDERIRQENAGDDCGDDELHEQLVSPADAFGFFLRDLEVI